MQLYNRDERTTYVLHEVVGKGGEGLTYRADQIGRDPSTKIAVAVKVLEPSAYLGGRVAPDDVYEQWVAQAQVVRSFSDYGLVPVQTVFRIAAVPGPTRGSNPVDVMIGRPALVTAWVNGESLASWNARTGSTLARLEVLRQAAEALDSFHRSTAHVHRDLHRGNFIVARRQTGREITDTARIIDYGLVRSMVRPRSGSKVYGFDGYVAPELVADEAAYSEATDVFAFAAVLYHQVVQADPPRIGPERERRIRRAVEQTGQPASVAHLLTTLLADEPSRRWPKLTSAATETPTAVEVLERMMGVVDPSRRRRRMVDDTRPTAPDTAREALVDPSAPTVRVQRPTIATAVMPDTMQPSPLRPSLTRTAAVAAAAFALVLIVFVIYHAVPH